MPSFTAETLLKIGREHGIGRFNVVHKKQMRDSAYLEDAIRTHPERFVGTAAIDPRMPNLSEELVRLRQAGIRACRIYPLLSQSNPVDWLQDEVHDELFRVCGDIDLTVACMTGPECFPEVDRMCRKHPQTTVTLDHCGLIGRNGTTPNPEELRRLLELARHPNLHIKLSGLHSLGSRTPLYDDMRDVATQIVAAFGPDRCMWGSDGPYQLSSPHSLQASIDFIDLLHIPSSQKDAIFGLTAQKLYFSDRKNL